MPKSTGLGAYHSLGRQDALNWRTHIFFAIPAALTGLVFDYPRLGGPAGTWLLLVTVAILAPIITIELMSQALGKSSWKNPHPILVATILLFAGLVRGSVFYFLGGAFEIVPADEIAFRFVGGPLYVLSIYMVGNYILLASLDHRRMAADLAGEREFLKQSKLSFESQLATLKLAQMSRVRELLAPAIWELGKLLQDAKLKKDASRAVSALRSLNDEVVRPLSHNMIQIFELPNLTREFGRRSKIGQFVLPDEVEISRILPITAFAPFMAVTAYSGLSALLNPLHSLGLSLLITSLLTLELWIIKILIGNQRVKLVTAIVTSLAVGTVLGLTAASFSYFGLLGLPSDIVPQAFTLLVVVMQVFLFLGIVQMQRNEVTDELGHAVEELRLLNSQLRQQVWLSQKTLATELHGSVQAALNASALRLAQIENPTAEDLDRVRTDIDAAMQRLGNNDYLEGHSIEELLEQICEVWDGSCELEYRLTEQVSSALAEDSAAAYCTLEVIREAVNNAIKHGGAKSIEIQLALRGNVVDLKVSNDGVAPSGSSSGLGSALFGELTMEHSIRSAAKTEFSALVPLSQLD